MLVSSLSVGHYGNADGLMLRILTLCWLLPVFLAGCP